ncbi:MAG: Uma2 family endonuclease [Deferrisomatales bacterium]
MTRADGYLDWERGRPEKSEYLDGQAYGRPGATDAHVTIAGNLFALLRSHLRGGPCRAYVADMKVRVSPGGPCFCPDVVVTCDERDWGSELFKEHPTLVVEVLSPGTAAFDPGRKFAWCRQVEALREYVLADAESPSAECFRKNDEGRWVLYPHGSGEAVELTSVGFSCIMDAVYEDVELP